MEKNRVMDFTMDLKWLQLQNICQRISNVCLARPGLASPWIGWACPGLPWARPKAGPVIRPEHAWRGPTSTKMHFLLKNADLGQFWSFLDLLDLKNGSGSKFRLKWWYREVWKSKFKPFRDKSMIHLLISDAPSGLGGDREA